MKWHSRFSACATCSHHLVGCQQSWRKNEGSVQVHERFDKAVQRLSKGRPTSSENMAPTNSAKCLKARSWEFIGEETRGWGLAVNWPSPSLHRARAIDKVCQNCGRCRSAPVLGRSDARNLIASHKSEMLGRPEVAAPEDGRTPSGLAARLFQRRWATSRPAGKR